MGYKEEKVERYRNGAMLERELVQGLDTDTAYRLILSVEAICKKCFGG